MDSNFKYLGSTMNCECFMITITPTPSSNDVEFNVIDGLDKFNPILKDIGTILYDISTGITWVSLGCTSVPPISHILHGFRDDFVVFKNKDKSNDYLIIANIIEESGFAGNPFNEYVLIGRINTDDTTNNSESPKR